MSRKQPHVWWRKVKEMPTARDGQGIRSAREILKPIPVIRGMPNQSKFVYHPGTTNRLHMFDHGGVSWIPNQHEDGGVVYWHEVVVGEPYSAYHNEGKELADKFGLYFYQSPNSFWFPGHSYRLEFWPAKMRYIRTALSDKYNALANPNPAERRVRQPKR